LRHEGGLGVGRAEAEGMRACIEVRASEEESTSHLNLHIKVSSLHPTAS
jgi:hypothetical protein